MFMHTFRFLLVFVFLLATVLDGDCQRSMISFQRQFSSDQSLGKRSSGEEAHTVLLDGWHKGKSVNGKVLPGKGKQWTLIPNRVELYNDSSSKDYYRKLKSLAKDLKKNTKHKLLSWPGCAGPEVKKVGEELAIIYVDTEWFFQKDHRSEFTNTKCATLWETDIWATLEDEIDDLEDRMICIVGHHSIYQESKRSSGWSFLYPYHGPAADFDSREYRDLRRRMLAITKSHGNVMYLSLNASKKQNRYPEKEIFAKDYDRIEFVGSKRQVTVHGIIGTIKSTIVTQLIQDSEQILSDQERESHNIAQDTLVATGAEYQASNTKRFWLGDNYRDEWATPVKLERLYVDQVEGGLVPYAKGGGAQTHSLKFKDPIGRKFAFRSVNKDALKNKDRPIMETAFGQVKQDLISSQLPFGDVVVGKLLDKTDILHVNPKPYIMADQRALGKFNQDFAGVIGTLEEKPTKKNKEREGFAQADKIVSTHEVYRRVLKSTKHQINREAYARCVMFDIWIADWDRHHDNWKWAMHKDGERRIYTPIPRDRDHAFAVFEGVIGNVSDVAAPNVAELRPEIVDIKGMTFQGKSMLYFLSSTISQEQWNDAARYVDSRFDRTNIEEAWNHIPEEISHFSKEKIIGDLVARKSGLVAASNEVYLLMNERAIFYGSNKDDQLTIDVSNSNKVIVTLADEHDQPTLTKTYDVETTKKLEIYTLDGKDDIRIVGSQKSNIDIILIPGTDHDEVIADGKPSVKIYDTQRYEDIRSKEVDTPIYPDIYGFQYGALLPFAMYQFDGDYGAGLEFKLTKFTQRFNKKPFGSRKIIAAKYFPRGKAIRLGIRALYTDVYGKWDGNVKIRGAHNDTRYDRYVGADVQLPDNYQDNYYRTKDYYVQNDNIDIYAGLVNDIYGQSQISVGVGTHYLKIQDGTGASASDLLVAGDIWQSYMQAKFNLDFTNSRAYPTQGIRYGLSTRVGYNLQANLGVYNNTEADITWFGSWRDVSRTIIVLKLGVEATLGNSSYIDYPILGNGNHVRGFSNNLIRSSSIGFVNTEIRKEIYQSRNKYLPFLLGVTAFYDRGVSPSTPSNNVSGYGGGLYMTFLNSAYSVYINNGWNTLNDDTIINYGIGFSL